MNTTVKNQTILLIYWALLALFVLAIDYWTGPFIRFPILYLFPIVLTSWINGLRWGLVLAVTMPLIHLSFSKFWITPFALFDAGINTCIRIVVFIGFAYLVNKVCIQKRELEKEILTLKGILPICSFCKRIRDQEGNWESLEGYITKRSDAKFSHGLCPECAKKNYPGFYKQ